MFVLIHMFLLYPICFKQELLEFLEKHLPLLGDQGFYGWVPRVGSLCGVSVVIDCKSSWYRVRVTEINLEEGKVCFLEWDTNVSANSNNVPGNQ